MDFLKINNRSIPYPNNFNMKKVNNVVAEIKTLSGRRIADVNGWCYEDQSFTWDTLLNEHLDALLDETTTDFVLEFVNTRGEVERVNAARISLEAEKTQFKEDGTLVWKDITLEVMFPDAYN